MCLLTLPSLCFVEETDVTSYLEVVTIEPDGALVVFTVLGVVDSAAFPLIIYK